MLIVNETDFRARLAEWHETDTAAPLVLTVPTADRTVVLGRMTMPSGISMLYIQHMFEEKNAPAPGPEPNPSRYLGMYDPRDGRIGDAQDLYPEEFERGLTICGRAKVGDWDRDAACERVRSALTDVVLALALEKSVGIPMTEGDQSILLPFMLESDDPAAWERSIVAPQKLPMADFWTGGYHELGPDRRELFADEEATTKRFVDSWLNENSERIDRLAEQLAALRDAYSAYKADPDPELVFRVSLYRALAAKEEAKTVKMTLAGPHGTCVVPIERERLMRAVADAGRLSYYDVSQQSRNQLEALYRQRASYAAFVDIHNIQSVSYRGTEFWVNNRAA